MNYVFPDIYNIKYTGIDYICDKVFKFNFFNNKEKYFNLDRKYYYKINLNKYLLVLIGLLLEESFLFVCNSISLVFDISNLIMSYYFLLKPFNWPYIIIPYLPNDLIDVIESPVPFIIGILNDNPNIDNKIYSLLNLNSYSIVRIDNNDNIEYIFNKSYLNIFKLNEEDISYVSKLLDNSHQENNTVDSIIENSSNTHDNKNLILNLNDLNVSNNSNLIFNNANNLSSENNLFTQNCLAKKFKINIKKLKKESFNTYSSPSMFSNMSKIIYDNLLICNQLYKSNRLKEYHENSVQLYKLIYNFLEDNIFKTIVDCKHISENKINSLIDTSKNNNLYDELNNNNNVKLNISTEAALNNTGEYLNEQNMLVETQKNFIYKYVVKLLNSIKSSSSLNKNKFINYEELANDILNIKFARKFSETQLFYQAFDTKNN